VQSASTNYIQAATGAGGAWAEPQLRADWWVDGVFTSIASTDKTLIVADSFDRVVIDGWGQTDTGHTWLFSGDGTVADIDVANGVGTHAISGSTDSARICTISGLTMLDCDILVSAQVAVPTGTGGGIEACTFYFRYDTAAGNYYQVRTVIGVGGAVTVAIFYSLAFAEVNLASLTVPGLTHQADEPLRVRARTVGSTIQIRVWRLGQAEPTSWHLTVTDSHVTAPGTVALRSAIYTGNTNPKPLIFSYDTFRAVSAAIDDLTRSTGDWSVKHFLDDGYPDSVTYISGIGVPELSATVEAPSAYLTNGPMRDAAFFSPYNDLSPMFGLDRDVAPVKLDHGVVGSAGQERVRVFTGQMMDVAVKSGTATLTATSATRLLMQKLVQPPPFRGNTTTFSDSPGANASWPISWALYQCGLYVGPPPRQLTTGTVWWTPMHGSTRPFYPSRSYNPDTLGSRPIYQSFKRRAADTVLSGSRPGWVLGPYLTGIDLQAKADEQRHIGLGNLDLDTAYPFFSQAGSTGRLEFWVRGDATDVNNIPGGSASVSKLVGIQTAGGIGVGTAGVEAGVNTSRQVYVKASDGTTVVTLTSTDTLPTDGAWHPVGAAWSISGKKLWLQNFNGTTRSTAVGAWTTSGLPAGDTWIEPYPTFVAYVPIAEVQLNAGTQANVDNFPTWLGATAFTADAVVSPSNIELAGVYEKAPREAWELIAGYAQGELASMRCDETDVFLYLTPGWWVKDSQQAVQEVLSTDSNADEPDINIDVTKIKNTIQVTYDAADIDGASRAVFSLSDLLQIPPGDSTWRFTFSDPVVNIMTTPVQLANDVDFTVSTFPDKTYITLNNASDGSGTFADSTMASVDQTIDWDAGGATWVISNFTTGNLYTVNNSNKPTLQIWGQAVHVTSTSVVEYDPVSVAQRGVRSLQVSASALDSDVAARALARKVKMGLRTGRPAVDALTLFGDARRQPGDLVTFTDPSLTKASGQWRTQSVTHTQKDGEFEQQVIVRPVLPICVVGTGRIGQTLVGPRST
jgi:hypothetical protein